MKKTAFNPPENKPKIDINKPEDFKPDGSFWHQPSPALWIYLVFIMASLYFWQGAQEKRRVAFHESGHKLVAESVPTGEPVHKVSIIPRGVAALGYTLQLPVEEGRQRATEILVQQPPLWTNWPRCWKRKRC